MERTRGRALSPRLHHALRDQTEAAFEHLQIGHQGVLGESEPFVDDPNKFTIRLEEVDSRV
jgi:hypothetical protein